MARFSVGVVGGTGYTGGELLRLLADHPLADVATVTSRTDAGRPVDEVHPALRTRCRLKLAEYAAEELARLDCVFCCLPHGAAAPVVRELAERGVRVVDLSADYRLSDPLLYQKTYGHPHPDPERLGSVPYGLPELFHEAIAGADVVANPGCFPTAAILPLYPLVARELIDTRDVIVDSKTGVSGGGRDPKPAFHFPECNESVAAYGVGNHRHQPEIVDALWRRTGQRIECVFTPHLVPMDRGILSTVYVRPRQDLKPDDGLRAIEDAYREEPFVRVGDSLPATKHVSGTNFCDIAIRQNGPRWILISAIDNLVKGAAGAAVQNFNVMFGLDSAAGLAAGYQAGKVHS
jgi:N-acetyl-gamma-glutamyl-phosphate reductase